MSSRRATCRFESLIRSPPVQRGSLCILDRSSPAAGAPHSRSCSAGATARRSGQCRSSETSIPAGALILLRRPRHPRRRQTLPRWRCHRCVRAPGGRRSDGRRVGRGRADAAGGLEVVEVDVAYWSEPGADGQVVRCLYGFAPSVPRCTSRARLPLSAGGKPIIGIRRALSDGSAGGASDSGWEGTASSHLAAQNALAAALVPACARARDPLGALLAKMPGREVTACV